MRNQTIAFFQDISTGENYYLLKDRWEWVGEIRFFKYNMCWLKNICSRHGIAIAEQSSQMVILFAHKNHKFDFAQFIEFLRTFFPIVYQHEIQLTYITSS